MTASFFCCLLQFLITVLPLSVRFGSIRQLHEETDQVKTAGTHKGVDNSGKPRHISKNKCYQVKTEQTNQAPVDGTYDSNGKRSSINIFISHISPHFCAVFCISYETGSINICKNQNNIHIFIDKKTGTMYYLKIYTDISLYTCM